MTKRKKGRKEGEPTLYTPEQTQRYQSEWSRYEQGMAMAAAHIPHKVSDNPKIYRIPSDRSPVGYWEVMKGSDGGGKITLQWEGEKEGKPFQDRQLSGCGAYSIFVGWAYKCKNPYPPPIGSYNPESENLIPISVNEFFSNYKQQLSNTSDPFTGTLLDALRQNGFGDGIYDFPGGNAQRLVGSSVCFQLRQEDCYFLSGMYVFILNPDLYPTGADVLSRISTIPFIEPQFGFEIVEVSNPSSSPGACELPYKPGAPDKKTFNCEYDLSEEEISKNWTIATNSNPGTIQNDRGQQKTVAACNAPEPLSNIKLKSIVKVEDKNREGEYSTTNSHGSNKWTEESEGIRSNFNYFGDVTDGGWGGATPYFSLPIGTIVKVTMSASVQMFNDRPRITLSWFSDAFSRTIDGTDNTLDDPDVQPGQQPVLGEVKLKDEFTFTTTMSPINFQVAGSWASEFYNPPATVKGEVIFTFKRNNNDDSSWNCTCPDYSKKIGAFTPPPYPSMSQPRSWESSAAGALTWADGKRRCKHIVAAQVMEREEIPVPSDFPQGEA